MTSLGLSPKSVFIFLLFISSVFKSVGFCNYGCGLFGLLLFLESAVANHFRTTHHDIHPDIRLLKSASKSWELKTWESIHINKRREQVMNFELQPLDNLSKFIVDTTENAVSTSTPTIQTPGTSCRKVLKMKATSAFETFLELNKAVMYLLSTELFIASAKHFYTFVNPSATKEQAYHAATVIRQMQRMALSSTSSSARSSLSGEDGPGAQRPGSDVNGTRTSKRN